MAILMCCGCISLKNGSLILGTLSCLGYFSFFVQAMINIIAYNKIPINNNVEKAAISLIKAGWAGVITFLIIMIAISIIFIIGINKRNKKCILLYLVTTFAQLVTSISAIISVTVFMSFSNLPGGLIFFIFIICILVMALHFYFWLVVYYHYKTLTDEGYGPTSHQYSV